MDIRTAIEASRKCTPVTYNGIGYKRIVQRITNINERGGESCSLALLDYCGSAVVIAGMEDVEVTEETNT